VERSLYDATVEPMTFGDGFTPADKICATAPPGKAFELISLRGVGAASSENNGRPLPSATGATIRANWSTSPWATRLRVKLTPPWAMIGLPSRAFNFAISSARSPLAT
jgi:hypothetical protein